jgi:NAD(P)-dependent dehydrogenase (short-subunit alcohol dehydrogenase family)
VILKDKVAIVTGGARALGKAYGLRLAQEGAKVVVADILDGQETVDSVKNQGGAAVYRILLK